MTMKGKVNIMAIFFAIVTVGLIMLGAWLFSTGKLPDIIGGLFHAVQPAQHNGFTGDVLSVIVMLVLMWVLWQGFMYTRQYRQGQHNEPKQAKPTTEHKTYGFPKGWLH